ncbi:MAG: lysophospholipid acyltransferase family protein [Armatimonadota bacterium]
MDSTQGDKPGLWERVKAELIFRLSWLISTALAASVRFTVEGWDRLEELVADGKGGIVVLWHGVTLLPVYYCRNMGFYSIVSLSRDGELQNRILRSRGFRTIRGSSTRHGMRALLESIRRLKKGGIMAITPDGPRGPARKVQPGTIHLAQRSGSPVLPVGVACRPCKRLSSWDSHMIPWPFARAVIVFGEPFCVGEDEEENRAARRIEDAINAAEHRANEILSGGPE